LEIIYEKGIKMSDKKETSIVVKLSAKDKELVQKQAEKLGVKASAFVRMLLYNTTFKVVINENENADTGNRTDDSRRQGTK
jgi:hypothetical protein